MERGRVPGSDEVISQRFFQVWTLLDGRIRAFREYKTQREAVEAAGVSGEVEWGGRKP
jgi:ketosteroid isomerase-like protein